MSPSRRDFLACGAAAVAAARVPRSIAVGTRSEFLDIIRPPDRVVAYAEGMTRLSLTRSGDGWLAADIEVATEPKLMKAGGGLSISVAAPQSQLTRLHLRWTGHLPERLRFLGDHWERSYGDLEWRGFAGERIMPWYFIASTEQGSHGYGVKTGAAAFCFWQVDPEGISLWLDVRNGGSGVKLGNRWLLAAEVIAVHGHPEIAPFQAAREFCRALCEHPRLPGQPVYGSNNWYYLYGENMSAENVLRDVEQLADLSPLDTNAPFMVLDMGWGKAPEGAGPWTEDALSLHEIPELAAQMKRRGARPGIWVRPLLTAESLPDAWQLKAHRKGAASVQVIDPSMPEALAHVQEGLRRVTGWGFELIKHDYSTFDLMGCWGFEMGAALTSAGWHFSDRSKTTSEILLHFYNAVREAVGNTILIGCNTVGHLGAGIFELQRIGDDTSGRDWNRTRKMGVNALAFRLAQHRTFFLADADCVPITKAIPLGMTRQWLDLVARSGTPLFISADPSEVGVEEKNIVRAALTVAAQVQPEAEPLDWMETTTPERWRLGGKTVHFKWFGEEGVYPF